MRVEVEGLSRRFGATMAVDQATFAFDSGHIYAFVGPNGAGKTTTLRILATVDVPDAGDARIDGVSLVQYPEKARRLVGFVPDTLPTQRDITVEEYLDFFARAHGLGRQRRRQVLDGLAEFTGLGPLRERLLWSLSKGMKQRVSVARALIHDPSVLILDEPAAGLDPRARIELRELLKALAGQGKAILVSSHILGELSEISHGTVIIEKGRIVRAGTMHDILAAEPPQHRVIIRPLREAEAVYRFLLERPEVSAASISGQDLEVSVQGTETACAGLLRELIMAGFDLVEFRVPEADLESLFLRVTSGELQ